MMIYKVTIYTGIPRWVYSYATFEDEKTMLSYIRSPKIQNLKALKVNMCECDMRQSNKLHEVYG